MDVYIVGKSEDNGDDCAGFITVYRSTFRPNGNLRRWKFFSHATCSDDVDVDSLCIFEAMGSLCISSLVQDGKVQYNLTQTDTSGKRNELTSCLLQEGLAPVQFLYDQTSSVYMLANDSKATDPRQLKLYTATIGEGNTIGCTWELIKPLPTVCDLGRMTIVDGELVVHSLQQEGVAVDGMFKLKVI